MRAGRGAQNEPNGALLSLRRLDPLGRLGPPVAVPRVRRPHAADVEVCAEHLVLLHPLSPISTPRPRLWPGHSPSSGRRRGRSPSGPWPRTRSGVEQHPRDAVELCPPGLPVGGNRSAIRVDCSSVSS